MVVRCLPHLSQSHTIGCSYPYGWSSPHYHGGYGICCLGTFTMLSTNRLGWGSTVGYGYWSTSPRWDIQQLYLYVSDTNLLSSAQDQFQSQADIVLNSGCLLLSIYRTF